MPNLTKVKGKLATIKQRLKKRQGNSLKFLKNGVVIVIEDKPDPEPDVVEVKENWRYIKKDYRPIGGKLIEAIEFFDVGGYYSQALATCDGLLWNGQRVKITNKDYPKEDTRRWVLEFEAYGNTPKS